MTTEVRNYGVDCKNPECDAVLTIGEKLSIAPPAHGGEVFQWPQHVAGTHTCPRCGQTFKYTEQDYQEFKSEPSAVEPLL